MIRAYGNVTWKIHDCLQEPATGHDCDASEHSRHFHTPFIENVPNIQTKGLYACFILGRTVLSVMQDIRSLRLAYFDIYRYLVGILYRQNINCM